MTSDWGQCLEDVCDPVGQTGCAAGEACYYLDADDGWTECWDEGTLVPGAECTGFGEMCIAGSDCVLQPGTDPTEYYCRDFCDADTPCPGGFSCTTTDATYALKFCMPN